MLRWFVYVKEMNFHRFGHYIELIEMNGIFFLSTVKIVVSQIKFVLERRNIKYSFSWKNKLIWMGIQKISNNLGFLKEKLFYLTQLFMVQITD